VRPFQGGVFFSREPAANSTLVPLGLLLARLAALVLPLNRTREVRAEVSIHGEPTSRGPGRER
jgi:hypothetical protein